MYQAFDIARENMVEGQIRPGNVTHAGVIAAMRQIPRERFVPRHLQGVAYLDEDMALGNGRFLPEPLVLARLIQAAHIQPDEVVLDIACGTGYSTAILGHLAGTVVALESDAKLVAAADTLLHELGVVNAAVVHQADLKSGYPAQEPYDVILMNGSVPTLPEGIVRQLGDGGRLVTVLSEKGHMGQAVMVTRHGRDFERQVLFDAALPMLRDFEAPEGFCF